MMIIKKYGYLLVAGSLLALNSNLANADSSTSGRSFGKSYPFEFKDLPASTLAEDLSKLPVQARVNAKNWLSRMNFHSRDIPYLRVDKNGGIFFADPAVPNALVNHYRLGSSAKALPIGMDVFKLHSKPGSSNVVYLDFNGELITNTAWNDYSGKLTLTALSYDSDGNTGSFSADEQASIAEIWRRVAEDYAPFDVDITTEQPTSFNATTGHAVITANVDANGLDMPSKASGGVSYVNVWGMPNYAAYLSPAFIYYNQVGGADNVAEAVSHELGHNLGLAHDGSSLTNYYRGHGTGWISWAPIMGASYYSEVTQWSNGEYADANQTQDDIALINLKLSPRPDDHSNSFSAASSLVVAANGTLSSTTSFADPSNSNIANKGIINSRTDVDYFKFSTSGGAVVLQADPLMELNAQRGGNLDIQLSLYDSLGNVVTINNPSDDTRANISTNLSAGNYYLAVDGAGSVNYSDYASLGQYFISGSIPTIVDITPPSPNPSGWSLAPTATSRTSVHMTAITATDSSNSVEYYFACVSGGLGCVDSGWVKNADYTIDGLSANTSYGFTVKARDSVGNETLSTAVSNATTLSNRAPIAIPDAVSLLNNTSIIVAVLANDSDPEADSIKITSVGSTAQKGTVTFSNSQISYTPPTGFLGSDNFTYTITDHYGASATATVSVTVSAPVFSANRPPVALADTAKIYTGTTVVIPVLANDKDPDGNKLSIIAVGGSLKNSTITHNGSSIIYQAGIRTGTDSFSYTISDGVGGKASTTVTVSLVKKF